MRKSKKKKVEKVKKMEKEEEGVKEKKIKEEIKRLGMFRQKNSITPGLVEGFSVIIILSGYSVRT